LLISQEEKNFAYTGMRPPQITNTNQMFKKLLAALGLLRKAEDVPSPAGETIAPSNETETDVLLRDLLIQVAQEFEDADRFSAAAKEVAGKLEFSRAKDLARLFHDNPPEPEALNAKTRKYGILGVWMNICQDAIFEILFNYKEEAIPTLNKIAFGDYDWTQYKAIDILCRLAIEGIQTQETINNIGDKIGRFRYEALFPALESLASIPENEEVPKIILRVFDDCAEDDPIDGLEILRLLVVNYPEAVKTKLAFLKSIAQGQGIEGRSPLLDGAVMSIDGHGNKSFSIAGEEIEGTFEETHRIHAAMLFFRLDREDHEINQLLDFWEHHAEKEAHRNRIAALKNRKN
jgi:hypothetical protein